jgi:hypothetical protein
METVTGDRHGDGAIVPVLEATQAFSTALKNKVNREIVWQ